jgi:long-chain acyl-CoA synthetase
MFVGMDVHKESIDISLAEDGRDGEVRIKGPNVMRGYYKLPAETAEAFDSEGWFRTGDIGRLDDQNFLSITGRLKEMIIVGGENVFPREIEEALDKHPAVNASAVIGVRDDVRGELPWAFVEMKEGQPFDESSLRTWCRERLAGYKVPREIRAVEKLPRNPTGKILRRELKKQVGV